jgi:hypothetical protein
VAHPSTPLGHKPYGGWRTLPRGTCLTLLRVPHSSVCEGCGFLLRAFEFPPWKREALSGGLDITFLVERFHRNFGYRVVRFTRGGWPTPNDRPVVLLIFRVAHPSDSAFGKGGALAGGPPLTTARLCS